MGDECTAPTVSVIIPTYNRRDYVQEAIDSVLAQTYIDYEVIVVDDGSTDGTGDALQARYGDRIRYLWQENQGESVARNRGIEMAGGEYIAFLDSDDLWAPHKLERQVSVLETQVGGAMLYCRTWLVDDTSRRIEDRPRGNMMPEGRRLLLESLCIRNWIGGPSSTLVRRGCVQQVGGFDPNIRFGEDWDLWLRIAKEQKIYFLAEPLAYLRRHRETQCYYPSPKRNRQRLEDYLAILEKVFSSWRGQLPAQLRRRALAYQYAEAFLAEEAVGNTRAARECLSSAADLDASLLGDMDLFGQLVTDYAVVVFQMKGNCDPEDPLDYADRVMGKLRAAGLGNWAFRRAVLAKVTVSVGFLLHRENDARTASQYFLRAIRYDPRWLNNLGILSILSRGLVSDWIG